VTSPATGADGAADLRNYAPVPRSALGPALNDQRYYVGRVERNLYWITDGVYQPAFLTTRDGVVVFDAPIVAKYTGVLAAVDMEIFTYTTTFQIMQSLRLDTGLGVSKPVNP
jgi:hypothetical protein